MSTTIAERRAEFSDLSIWHQENMPHGRKYVLVSQRCQKAAHELEYRPATLIDQCTAAWQEQQDLHK